MSECSEDGIRVITQPWGTEEVHEQEKNKIIPNGAVLSGRKVSKLEKKRENVKRKLKQAWNKIKNFDFKKFLGYQSSGKNKLKESVGIRILRERQAGVIFSKDKDTTSTTEKSETEELPDTLTRKPAKDKEPEKLQKEKTTGLPLTTSSKRKVDDGLFKVTEPEAKEQPVVPSTTGSVEEEESPEQVKKGQESEETEKKTPSEAERLIAPGTVLNIAKKFFGGTIFDKDNKRPL